MYKTIQKVRTETENLDIISTNSTPLTRSEALRASMPNLGVANNGNDEDQDLNGGVHHHHNLHHHSGSTAKLFARNSAEW